MKKLFISVPMRDRTDEEVLSDMKVLKDYAEYYFGTELEVLDTFKAPDINTGNISVHCLGRSIQYLSQADFYIGFKDPGTARGCYIENQIIELYGFIESVFIDNIDSIYNFMNSKG